MFGSLKNNHLPTGKTKRWKADDVTVTEPATVKRAIHAAAIGNVTEWYDFGVYGYLALTIEGVFLPDDSGAAGKIIVAGPLPHRRPGGCTGHRLQRVHLPVRRDHLDGDDVPDLPHRGTELAGILPGHRGHHRPGRAAVPAGVQPPSDVGISNPAAENEQEAAEHALELNEEIEVIEREANAVGVTAR